MHTTKSGAGAALLILVIVAFAGCMNPFSGSEETESSSTGSLTISLSGFSPSTVLPNVSDQIATYELTLAESGSETVEVTQTAAEVADNSNAIVVTKLIVGSWDITIDGRNDSGEIVATGTQTGVSVSDGGTATVTIMLEPALNAGSGTGDIEVTIDWSSSSINAIDGGEASLDDGTTVIDAGGSLTIDTASRTATFSDVDRESGEYTLAITLLDTSADPDLLYAAVVEAVHVYDNLTSSKTITLSDADLSTPPTAPTGFSAEPNSISGSDTVELTWTDAAKTETSYEIERSSDGGSSWISIASLAAGEESYQDRDGGAGLSADTAYDYRIRAENAFGGSAWVSDATATTPLIYIYVSFTGNDANSGSAFRPVATVDQALSLTDSAVANQEIRVEGRDSGTDTFTLGNSSYAWPDDTDLQGGYESLGAGAWSHSPGTHTTVIEETSGTDDVTFTVSGGSVSISDVTIEDLSTDTYPVIDLIGAADFTMDKATIEAQGTDYAHAIRVNDTPGGSATSATVRNSTLRVLDGALTGSFGSFFDVENNIGLLLLAVEPAGSVALTDTDIEVGAGKSTMGVYIREGDFSMTGGSISFTADAGEASRGIYGHTESSSHGVSLSLDGVSITTANTTEALGVNSVSVASAVNLDSVIHGTVGAITIRNSTLTPGTTTGPGRSDGITTFRNSFSAESITIVGNTVNMSSAGTSTDGRIVGMRIGGNRTATTKETIIERNAITFDDTVDETAGSKDEAIGFEILADDATGESLDFRVANNLIYREDGSDADFAGMVVYDGVNAPFIGNNTIVSLDTSGAFGVSFTGIEFAPSSLSPELVNNIIAAGSETNSVGIRVDTVVVAPSRLSNNFVRADTLIDYTSSTDVTTIADLNDATKSTEGGSGTAANNVGEGSDDAPGSAPALGFADTTSPGYDFSLTGSSDASLQSGGLNLSAASLSTTTIDTTFTDIDGTTRDSGGTNGSDWSIGAYEY